MKNLGATNLPTVANTQWVATVIGFRGDSLSPASGEMPDWGCNTAQGYFLSKPVCADELTSWLQARPAAEPDAEAA